MFLLHYQLNNMGWIPWGPPQASQEVHETRLLAMVELVDRANDMRMNADFQVTELDNDIYQKAVAVVMPPKVRLVKVANFRLKETLNRRPTKLSIGLNAWAVYQRAEPNNIYCLEEFN